MEWVEASLARLYLDGKRWVLGGLRRMQPASEEARKAIDNCWVYLHDHRQRTHYGKFRRGGYPIGSGGLNRQQIHLSCAAQALWDMVVTELHRNEMLGLRCAKYNGIFDRVFKRHGQRLQKA